MVLTRRFSHGDYDSMAYHHNEAYDGMIRAARNQVFPDAYVPGHRIYYGKAAKHDTTLNANLDHVISAKEIHDDRGRVLSGLDGVDLANRSSNLQFTNEKLNKSMGDKTIEEYINWREQQGNPLSQDVQQQMREKDTAARTEYNQTISREYYTSNRFWNDLGIAATKRGLEMGLRQVLGFVFLEIWFSCEQEIQNLPSGITFKDCVQAIVRGIHNGIFNVKDKYKLLLSQFEQGFIAGALASISTSLINIFLTTDKNMVRYIRQISTIVIQTGNILLINPDDLALGDQLKAATVSLSTGASVLVGTAVGNEIAKTPIGQESTVGKAVIGVCSSLVSGLMSCTLLLLIERSELINKVVSKLNVYVSIDRDIREISSAFIRYAAEIANYDIGSFCDEVNRFEMLSGQIQNAADENLQQILLTVFEEMGISLPWSGDFDEFMTDSTNTLVFG